MPFQHLRLSAASLVALWAALLFLATGQGRAAEPPRGPLPVGNERAAEFPGLHHVFRLSERLYSGSVPEGEEGFRSLQLLGIHSVLTVDGAPPDVERAHQYGMRYAHLPFGYDGCPSPTADRIVRAARDLPAPIYLHCHHGRHRSPTAAAFARIALDGISNEQAVRELERAGTGKEYAGLYASVRAYRPPGPAELDRVSPEFPETAATPPLMDVMVRIDAQFELLLRAQKAGWKPEGAGQDCAHDALQLRELYTELNRTTDVKRRPPDFRRWMTEGETQARKLEAALRRGRTEEAGMSLGRIAAGCGTCHAKYRNVPQDRGRESTLVQPGE